MLAKQPFVSRTSLRGLQLDLSRRSWISWPTTCNWIPTASATALQRGPLQISQNVLHPTREGSWLKTSSASNFSAVLPSLLAPCSPARQNFSLQVSTSLSTETEAFHGSVNERPSVQLKPAKQDDVDKIVTILQQKHPSETVGDAALENIRTLLGLGAKRAQVVRIFAQSNHWFENELSSPLHTKAFILSGFRITTSVLLRSVAKSIEWLRADDEQLGTVLGFLDEDLGINNLAKVISVNPWALEMSLEELKKVVSYLESSLQIEDPSTAINRSPGLLGNGLDDIVSKVGLLRRLLDYDEKRNIQSVLEAFPSLLLVDASILEKTHGALVATLGVEGTKKVMECRPNLLTAPSQTVATVAEGLITLFGRDGAAEVLGKCAALGRRSWPSIEDKFLFVTEEMKRPVEEIREWPAVLGMNLAQKLELRYSLLIASRGQGRERQKMDRFKLRSIYGCSDEVFERRFRVALPEKGRVSRKLPART
eukprot:TRINITY_DN29473_c0_g1_i1.p1 TRINITY_DN29473_c0_g1~~TRINITY_DN29473_c0_g1_i1.p1  ORF type:complete len:481 (+),score=41.49 TRINITY_DN29473_c0_g1_i1:176-1618(+)